MTCSACNNTGNADPCAFCYESGMTELLERSIHEVKARLTVEKGCYSLNGRYWHKYQNEIVEVTEAEMKQLKNGKTIIEILEVRLA